MANPFSVLDNPPAFPATLPGHTYGDGSSESPSIAQEGMTLRDYFAGQAIAGIMTSYNTVSLDTPQKAALPAKEAYAIADAMLDARKAAQQ